MPNVSNAELAKLITNLQEDLNNKCAALSKAQEESSKVLNEKMDGFGVSLDRFEQRLDTLDENHVTLAQKFVQIEEKVDEIDSKHSEGFTSVVSRVAQLEVQLHRLQEVDLPEEFRKLRQENDKLKEELESRTNRQLRRTLVFRNIPEEKEDETYAEVKALLARTISSCSDITEAEAFAGIERAHREAKREDSNRKGKRKIYAAFLNWELPQRIIEEFRKRCIADRSFELYVDQMYGPLTTQRRHLAFQMRKSLKDAGTISSGFVAFPARLMINKVGDVDRYGKKIYRLHENFSDHKVERK